MSSLPVSTKRIGSRLANWLQRYSSLKVWMTDDDDRWTKNHWYTIRLIWVFAGRTVTLLVLSCQGSYDRCTNKIVSVLTAWRTVLIEKQYNHTWMGFSNLPSFRVTQWGSLFYFDYTESSKNLRHVLKCLTVKILKIPTVSFYYRVMGPKDADGMENSVDPDQTGRLLL